MVKEFCSGRSCSGLRTKPHQKISLLQSWDEIVKVGRFSASRNLNTNLKSQPVSAVQLKDIFILGSSALILEVGTLTRKWPVENVKMENKLTTHRWRKAGWSCSVVRVERKLNSSALSRRRAAGYEKNSKTTENCKFYFLSCGTMTFFQDDCSAEIHIL